MVDLKKRNWLANVRPPGTFGNNIFGHSELPQLPPQRLLGMFTHLMDLEKGINLFGF